MTDNDGDVTKSYDYDAFGCEKQPDPLDVNPFRYCGEYYDVETGSYYLRARYYAPTIGRFTQQDTHWTTANMIYGDNPKKINEKQDALGLNTYAMIPQITAVMQALNLYVYGINNPIVYTDIGGNSIIIACLLIGALAGGYIARRIANIKGVTGWNKVGYITAGVIVGGGIGALGGYAITTALPAATVTGGAVGSAATASASLDNVIYSCWQEAEQAVRNAFHAVKYTFSNLQEGMASRIVDGYNADTGIIYEVKYGYASLSEFIKTEIQRALYLIQNNRATAAEWHFFVSQATGKGGLSGPLRQALEEAGIKIVIH